MRQMYEDWSTKTPVITRGSMLAIFAVYVLSFFFALDKVSAAPLSAVQCSESTVRSTVKSAVKSTIRGVGE
jgi:uncharacterized membrane protein YgaE (UPF0421/DUF939 family)